MWILKFLPDWFLHLSLIASVLAVLIGTLLGNLSFVKQYTTILKVVGGFVLVLTLFLEGALHDNKVWEARVLEVEAKLAKAEAEAAAQNTKLTDKVATKQQQVKEKVVIVKQYIDREVTKYDTKFMPGGICEIPKEFIKAHNDATEPTK
jgi:thiol:disulfide interchange protein